MGAKKQFLEANPIDCVYRGHPEWETYSEKWAAEYESALACYTTPAWYALDALALVVRSARFVATAALGGTGVVLVGLLLFVKPADADLHELIAMVAAQGRISFNVVAKLWVLGSMIFLAFSGIGLVPRTIPWRPSRRRIKEQMERWSQRYWPREAGCCPMAQHRVTPRHRGRDGLT